MDAHAPFDQFWTYICQLNKQGNNLCYHPCCDVWTSRYAETKKASHTKTIQWKELVLTLDRSAADKKQALQAKMIEEGMQVPIKLNEYCKHNSEASVRSKRGRKAQQKVSQPEPLQPSLVSQDFVAPPLGYSDEQDLCKFYTNNKPSLIPNKLSVSKPPSPSLCLLKAISLSLSNCSSPDFLTRSRPSLMPSKSSYLLSTTDLARSNHLLRRKSLTNQIVVIVACFVNLKLAMRSAAR